jgi:hypothetical protein
MFFQMKEIGIDYLCVSLVAGSIDWFFSFIPIRPTGIIGTMVSLMQLGMATVFCISTVSMLKSGGSVSMFFPLFVWYWSPRASSKLHQSYRNMFATLYGNESTSVDNTNNS